MGRKAAETTRHLAQELLMNLQCGGDSRSFIKKTSTLKMMSVVTGPWKLTITN